MSSPQRGPSSDLRRRLVPPLVALTVLAVLLGGAYVLRRGPTDAAGDGGGAKPTVLRLSDYQQPTAGNPADNQFRLAADLPDGPADAAVRWLTSPERAQVARLAKALGMRGELTTSSGATTYTTNAATLRVQHGAGGQWQYARAAFADGFEVCPPQATPMPLADEPQDTVACAAPVPLDDPTRGPVAGPGPVTGSLGATKSLAVIPPEAARAAARPVLEAVGIDPDDAVVRGGVPQGIVVADPTVADLATHGLATTLRVSGQQVNAAGGWLGGTRVGAAYPVISARAAWQQLMSTPFARPLIACPEPQPSGTDPMICGGPITVTRVRFGLSLHEESDRPLLVPSWLFDVRGSENALSVIAVDPSYLAAPPAPTAGGSEPGQGGSGSGGSTGTVLPPVAPSSGTHTDTAAPPPPESRFTSVTASGSELVVGFTGGVRACYTYTVVRTETTAKVSLTLVERTSPNKLCVEMAQVYERHVALAEPLGMRQVVDADTGAVLLAPTR